MINNQFVQKKTEIKKNLSIFAMCYGTYLSKKNPKIRCPKFIPSTGKKNNITSTIKSILL